jgi:hypothetical protein
MSKKSNYAWSTLDRPLRITVATIPFVAFIGYVALVSHCSLNLVRPQPMGLVFNNMLSHLLEGRFDVDPQTVGAEAFVHNGRTYAYFGIFPALLRLPLVPFHVLGTMPFTQVSCILAILVGGIAQAGAFAIALLVAGDGHVQRLMLATLLVAGFCSGPGIMLGYSSVFYDEPVLWAWALAVVFVAMAMHGLLGRRWFSTGLLTSMAAVAGCCLLTRPSTGMGLLATIILLLMSLRFGRGAQPRPTIDEPCERLWQQRFWPPILVLTVFAGTAAVVNQGRWENPLSFGDLRDQIYIMAMYPDRSSRMHQYGLFNIERLPFGIMYYFVPVWNAAFDRILPLGRPIAELFDGLEAPASSLLLTDPLTSLLATAGLYGLIRRRIDVTRGPAFAILAGLACSPALMLTAWYMTFRYRAEFSPVMMVAASLGIGSWSKKVERMGHRQKRIAATLLVSLCSVQVLSTGITSYSYARAGFGPVAGYRGISLPWTIENWIHRLGHYVRN